MKLSRTWIWFIAAWIALAAPASALALEIPVPARLHLIKQDEDAGYIGKLARIVSKPLLKGNTFALPSGDPSAIGATLKFFKVGTPGTWSDLNLPAAQWIGLGNPAGSQGFRYRGIGSLGDPCTSVLLKETVIKATCKGPFSTNSPFAYTIPVNTTSGAAWELVIGGDRYCAESSAATAPQVKTNDGIRGVYKAIKASAPLACPVATGP